MGRSQRHLRDIRGVDSSGWDTRSNARVEGFVCDGDSITFGTANPSYPAVLATLTNMVVINRGVGGERLITQMEPTFATDVAPFYSPFSNTLVLLAGTNDFGADGASVNAVRNAWISYTAKARAAGFKVVACTILPTTYDPAVYSAAGPTANRNAFNTWLRANYAGYADALVDLAATTNLTNPDNTTYYADKLHPTAAGYAIIAEAVRAKMGVPVYTPPVRAYATLVASNASTVLSNGNKTMANPAGNPGEALSSVPIAKGTKRYFEVKMDSMADNWIGVGVAGQAINGAYSLGFDVASKSLAYLNDGSVVQGFVTIRTYPGIFVGNGGVVGVCVDRSGAIDKIWISPDGKNFYGDGGTYNILQVAAGTGGQSLAAVVANTSNVLYGAVSLVLSNGKQATVNFGASAWLLTRPTGFTGLVA